MGDAIRCIDIQIHLRNCIHCLMQCFINFWRQEMNELNYYKVLTDYSCRVNRIFYLNYFICKRFMNKRKFFDAHLESYVNEIKANRIAPSKIVDSISAFFMSIQMKNIGFIFRSQKNVRYILYLLAICENLSDQNNKKQGLTHFFGHYLIKLSQRLPAALQKKSKEHKENCSSTIMHHCFDYLDNRKTYNEILMRALQRRWLYKNFVTCGNDGCSLHYMEHKYGNESVLTKSPKVINKWYICKGCECVRYCSKECQKISWNKQNHGYQCKVIQKI